MLALVVEIKELLIAYKLQIAYNTSTSPNE